MLEYNEEGKLALTQYEDWELDEAAEALALMEELEEVETVDVSNSRNFSGFWGEVWGRSGVFWVWAGPGFSWRIASSQLAAGYVGMGGVSARLIGHVDDLVG